MKIKYILVKCESVFENTKAVLRNEYGTIINPKQVDLTEEELNNIFKEAHLGISETYGSAQEYRKRMKPVEKIRKVLDNENQNS